MSYCSSSTLNPSHDLEAFKSRKTSTPCRLQMWECVFRFLETIALPWVVWELSLMDFKTSFSFHGKSYEENGALFGMLSMMDPNHGLQICTMKNECQQTYNWKNRKFSQIHKHWNIECKGSTYALWHWWKLEFANLLRKIIIVIILIKKFMCFVRHRLLELL